MFGDASTPLVACDGQATQTRLPPGVADGPGPARGSLVDRYVVLGRVGAGGMGVVYAAYDPKLDRRVALKVLSGTQATIEGALSRGALEEAHALAKLSHPNVVTVHDVGVHDHQAFIAMEFVEGQTVAAWLASASRSVGEILRVYRLAGRGLAAAHAVGLVHRDFKPDNVMIAQDGRVLVTDFGLARVTEGLKVGESVESGPLGSSSIRSGLVGTPAYMAPEQFRGAGIGPWSDQFSFCVALYQALFGHPPFAGNTPAMRAEAVQLPPKSPPRTGARVPARVRRAVLQGLDPEATKRHRSMGTLLGALAPERSRWRGFAWVSLTAVAAAGVATTVTAEGGSAQRRCVGAASVVDEVWAPARRESIGQAFATAETSVGDQRWAALEPRLTNYVDAWRGEVQDACAATHVRAEQSQERLAARLACLGDERAQLDALLEEFSSADARLVHRADQAVFALPDPALCAEPAALVHRERERVSADRQAVAVAEQELARAKARNDAGRYLTGIDAADKALSALGERELPRLRAEALYIRGQLEQRAGDAAAGEQSLRKALEVAVPAGEHAIAAKTWIKLIHVVGALQARPSEALAMELPAQLEVSAAGSPTILQHHLQTSLGNAAMEAGDYGRGLKHYEAVVALTAGADPLTRAVSHSNHGNALHDLGRYAEARVAHGRALDLTVDVLGEQHPTVAIDQMNLARDMDKLGELAEARGLYLQSLAIRRASLGDRARGTAETLYNLAVLDAREGNLASAWTRGVEAQEIFAAAVGAAHPLVAAAHSLLGSVAKAQERWDVADHHQGAAEEILIARFGPNHPDLATVLGNRGNIAFAREQYAAAQEFFGRAIAIGVAGWGPDHPALTLAYEGRARTLLAQGRADACVPDAERAVGLAEAGGDPASIADGSFTLARCLWEVAGPSDRVQRERALALAEHAREAWRSAPAQDPERDAQCEAWLAARR